MLTPSQVRKKGIIIRPDEVPDTVFLRDPTRGGLAGVAADISAGSGLGIELIEERIPVRPQTAYAAEMLGLDPLTVANEGKVVAVVRAGDAERALAALRGRPEGRDAAVIGAVTDAPYSEKIPPVTVETDIGASRFAPLIEGAPLPRIC